MAMEIFTMMRRSSGSGSICPAKDWHTLSNSYGYICRSTSKILDSLMFFFKRFPVIMVEDLGDG